MWFTLYVYYLPQKNKRPVGHIDYLKKKLSNKLEQSLKVVIISPWKVYEHSFEHL